MIFVEFSQFVLFIDDFFPIEDVDFWAEHEWRAFGLDLSGGLFLFEYVFAHLYLIVDGLILEAM